MERLHFDQDIRSMTEFRTSLTSFIKQVQTSKRPLVITQNGRGAAVLLDVKEYERIIEKMELLEDIQKGISQIESGKGISNTEAKNQILKVC